MKSHANLIASLEAKDARIKELEDWKDSAMTVLGDWSALFDALPDNYTQQPKFLGSSLSVIIGGYIMELQSELSSVQELRKKWGGDTFGHLPIAQAFDAYCEMQAGKVAALEAESAILLKSAHDKSAECNEWCAKIIQLQAENAKLREHVQDLSMLVIKVDRVRTSRREGRPA